MNSRNSRLQIKFRIRKAFVVRMLVLAVLAALLLSACALSRQGPAEANEKTPDSKLTLEVALYPYVPDPDALRQAVAAFAVVDGHTKQGIYRDRDALLLAVLNTFEQKEEVKK